MPITLTLKRASDESGLSVRTLHDAIAQGRVKTVRVGKRRLIPVRALEDFLFRGKEVDGIVESGFRPAKR